MGLDFDVFKELVAKLLAAYVALEGSEPLEVVRPQLYNGSPTGPLPKTIIVDSTSDINSGLIHTEKNANPATRLTLEQLTLARSEHWTRFFNTHPCMVNSNCTRLVLLIDTPIEVTPIKSLQHATRRKAPYTQQELRDLRITEDYELLNTAFGSVYIWGDRERLWSTNFLKPVIGSFFHLAEFSALNTLATNQGTDFTMEGAFDGKYVIASKVGARVASIEECRTQLWDTTGGEADTKVLAHIDQNWEGGRFLVRTDDGDLICILLLYLLRKQMEGIAIDALPSIWIDRTCNHRIFGNVDNPYKFLNITKLYQVILVCGLRVESFVCALLLRGCDFVLGFGQLSKPRLDDPNFLWGDDEKKGMGTAALELPATKIAEYIFASPKFGNLFKTEWDAVDPTLIRIRILDVTKFIRQLIQIHSGPGKPANELLVSALIGKANVHRWIAHNVARLEWTLLYWINPTPVGDNCFKYNCFGPDAGWILKPAKAIENSSLLFSIPPEEYTRYSLSAGTFAKFTELPTLFKVACPK